MSEMSLRQTLSPPFRRSYLAPEKPERSQFQVLLCLATAEPYAPEHLEEMLTVALDTLVEEAPGVALASPRPATARGGATSTAAPSSERWAAGRTRWPSPLRVRGSERVALTPSSVSSPRLSREREPFRSLRRATISAWPESQGVN